jgi:hypothetical protein
MFPPIVVDRPSGYVTLMVPKKGVLGDEPVWWSAVEIFSSRSGA